MALSAVPKTTTTPPKTRRRTSKTKPPEPKPSFLSLLSAELYFVLYVSVIFQINMGIDVIIFLILTRSINFMG